MTRPRRPRGWRRRGANLLLGAVVALLGAVVADGRAAAQDIAGVALGPQGEPLVEIPVVLHRVGAGSGAGFVATEVTDSAGRFRFALGPGDAAIYFAAVRYEDGIYIGPAVEAGPEPVTGYTLRVAPQTEAGAVASALAGAGPLPGGGTAAPGAGAPGSAAAPGRAPSDGGALLLVALLAMTAAAAFVAAAPRYRRRRTREALIELATLEQELAEPDPGRGRAELERARDRLRRQLEPGG